MADGIYVALSGAIAQSANLEATAANLANAGTDGYQRVRPVFREELARAGAREPAMHYSSLVQTQIDTTRGTTRATGRQTDFALPEGSYLAVSTTGGERYTRAASLSFAADGSLHTAHGNPVLAENGKAIKLTGDTGNARVDASGQLWQGDELVARLKIVSFPTPSALTHESGALLASSPAAGTPAASRGPLEVGVVEESNANVVGSMTELVDASRTFEAFQRVIDAFRDADRAAATTLPNVSP
jgi:flagellar basal body rod protein FlgG